ncbi:MAG: helix-turn-helix transcriptional regulator [Candidatus Thiodiazotropha sp.]
MAKAIANCYDPVMVNIRTIRKANLLHQIARFDSQRAFADKAGLVPAHVSQMVTNRRKMGDEVARRIEKNLDLADGHMDLQHQPSSYEVLPKPDHLNRIADSDSETRHSRSLKRDKQQQRLSAKIKKLIQRIEQVALEGTLSDEDWELLERLLDRLERGD